MLTEIMNRKMSQPVELCHSDEINSTLRTVRLGKLRYCVVRCTAAADIIGGVSEFRDMRV